MSTAHRQPEFFNVARCTYRIKRADRRRFDDLCETAARAIAFNGVAEGSLPQVASELMVEASELAGGWDGFDPSAKSGTTPLPIVDQVTDRIHARANELRRAFSSRVQRACAEAAKSMALASEPDRMSVAEAASAAGVCPQTIRNRVASDGIGYFDQDTHRYVVFVSKLKAALLERHGRLPHGLREQ
jgi:hypothetical protein